MQLHFTEESFKENTKLMLEHLKKQGFDIPLGKGLEAASVFCGSKTWNVMSAKLAVSDKNPAVSAASARNLVSDYIDSNVRTNATITASMHTDDYAHEVDFDATAYFKDADFESLLELQRQDWRYCEVADEIARRMEPSNPAISAAFDYLSRIRNTSRACGFEVSVDETEVYKWLRAFDYVMFVKLMVTDKHHLLSLSDNGFNVRKVPTATVGKWQWCYIYRGKLSQNTYDTEELAWEAMGAVLVEDPKVSIPLDILGVLPKSGRWSQ